MIIPKKVNLLYIEDDVSTADVVFDLLKSSKHTKFNIDKKGSLKDGMEHLKSNCPNCNNCNIDVILLDLVLPNSRGVDTYKAISSICSFLPVVIISGFEDMACECVALGAQDYLLKSDINAGVIIRSLKYALVRASIEKALKESEKQYREIVEATKAGVYEIDFVNDRFTYVNDVMCELTGWTKEELLSMGPSQLLTERSLNDWIERWAALNRGEYIDEAFEYEVKIKDGSTRWALVTAEFKENEKGVVVGARVIAIDITATKKAEQEAKNKEEIIFSQLEDKIHQWRDEISLKTLSHENQLNQISMGINSIATNSEV